MALKKKIIATLLITVLSLSCLSGCAVFKSRINDLNGSITGNTYAASFYTNTGEKFMSMSGKKIDLKSNIVEEQTYSGDKVYWEVCDDLPKTTKLMIDGKALYIHRANFQIIDKDLLD